MMFQCPTIPALLTISKTIVIIVIIVWVILEAQPEPPNNSMCSWEMSSFPLGLLSLSQCACAAFEHQSQISRTVVTFLLPLCALQQRRQGNSLHFWQKGQLFIAGKIAEDCSLTEMVPLSAEREMTWLKEACCGVVTVVVFPNILLRSGVSQPSIAAPCVTPPRVLDAFPDETPVFAHLTSGVP